MNQRLDRIDDKWPIIFIFTICLIWALSMGSVGWTNGLSIHGFRQTQTAITSYYLVRGGPFLRYETPIFGAPWSIPFEFPLYQWVVAFVSTTFRLQLEPSGRLISELFFWLSLLASWAILSELRVRPIHRLVFITLILVSPQYIYYSRTFMIESTAVFFCTAYLYFFIRYTRTQKLTDACLGAAFGLIGALVKLTTFPAFALIGGLIYLRRLYMDHGNFKNLSRSPWVYLSAVQAVVLLVGIPVLITAFWVQFTDHAKTLNIVSNGYLTSDVLHDWTFGTWQQRFSGRTWMRLWSQTVPELSGKPLILILPCLGLCFVPSRLVPFLVSIAGFLSAFLIFTNLHVVHDYYAYANGMFLIAAFSWCIVGLLEGRRLYRYCGLAIFLICICNSIWVYYGRLYGYQKIAGRAYASLASAIKDSTKPSDVILIFQSDWSPELAYSAERRALMWPRWMEQKIDAPPMRESLARLKGETIGAVVFCDQAQANSDLISGTVSRLGFAQQPFFQDATCTLFLSTGVTKHGEPPDGQIPERVSAPSGKAANYGGAVDTVTCDAISGWVWDSADANQVISVIIRFDGQTVGTAKATNSRPDLKVGTGKYGFSVSVPPAFKDGKEHRVSAEVSGAGYDIKVWEKIKPSFTCGS